MKCLSNITPRCRANFARLLLMPKSSIGNIEVFALLSFILDKEDFTFIWVQCQEGAVEEGLFEAD